MMRFERGVSTVNDGVECHRSSMAHSEEQPFAGQRIKFAMGLDHELFGRIAQRLLAQRFQRFRIEAKGRADLVESIEKIFEGIDSDPCLAMRGAATETRDEAARRPHRPGREVKRASFFLGNEFRRAHECILIMRRAVRE